MCNRNIPQSLITINAGQNFSAWLRRQLQLNDLPINEFAANIGIARSSVCAYLNGARYPKLDILAEIYDYFGKTEITISLKDNRVIKEET